MASKRFQDLQVYQLTEKLSDEIWKIVETWDYLAKDTIGKQLVRSADSIGANIAEGVGRNSFQDNRRFAIIARGSLNETQHWLRRAYCRKILSAEEVNTLKLIINELAPKLNSYIKSIGNMPNDK